MVPSPQLSLWVPLLVGMGASFFTIVIHALMLTFIIRQVRRDFLRGRFGVRLWTDLMLVTGVTLLALAGHLVEVGLWALTLLFCVEVYDFAAAYYHSAANYTTVGDSTV